MVMPNFAVSAIFRGFLLDFRTPLLDFRTLFAKMVIPALRVPCLNPSTLYGGIIVDVSRD